MVGLDDHRPSGRSPSADGTSSGQKNWQQLEVGNRPGGMWRRPCSNWCEGYIHVASHARMVEEEDLVVSRQRCDNIPGRPIFESHPRVLQQDRAQCAVGCHGCFESFRKGHIVLGHLFAFQQDCMLGTSTGTDRPAQQRRKCSFGLVTISDEKLRKVKKRDEE